VVTGTLFNSSTFKGNVSIGGISATVFAWSPQSVVVITGPAQPTVSSPLIMRRYDLRLSNTLSMSYDPPLISSVTPSNGPTSG
jgi:hypothetical protein